MANQLWFFSLSIHVLTLSDPGGGGPFCHTLQLIDRQSFMDGYFNFNTRWFFKLKVYALPIEAKKNFFHESFSEILIFIKNFVRKIDL